MGRFSLAALCFLLAIALLPFCSAATLHGTVYDADLNKVDDAIVEINSVPSQRVVSENGGYSFELNPGDYALNAYEKQGNYTISSAQENISIKQEGSYVYDLFLFPSLDEDVLTDVNDINVEDVDLSSGSNSNISGYIFLAIIIIGIAAVIVFVMLQMQSINAGKGKKPSEEPAAKEKAKEEKVESRSSVSDLDTLIELIKKDGGRTTQKELRKQMPHSEAKISLMLTELEHKGKIERIKKGRGNIIVLK